MRHQNAMEHFVMEQAASKLGDASWGANSMHTGPHEMFVHSRRHQGNGMRCLLALMVWQNFIFGPDKDFGEAIGFLKRSFAGAVIKDFAVCRRKLGIPWKRPLH